MRLFIFFIFILFSIPIKAQGWHTYLNDAYIFELLEQHTTLDELFAKRDSSFTIEQYGNIDTTESFELSGGTFFSFLDHDVINVQGFNSKMKFEKPSYWKLTTNKKGTRSIYPIECNRKGKNKRYNDFKTYDFRKLNNDSIVEEISWRVNRKGDTSGYMLSKWVYSKDTLKEFWQGTVLDNKPSWESQEIYSIDKYSYPRNNVTVIERLLMIRGKLDRFDNLEVSKTYNQLGRLTSTLYTYSNQPNKIEVRYYYNNGKWEKTESWQGDKLYEITKKNHR